MHVIVGWLAVGLALPPLLGCAAGEPRSGWEAGKVVLAIHGGEGDLDPMKVSPEEKKKIEEKLAEALTEGRAAMKARGGTSLDGVEAAIRVMEDSGLFDAGKGSVLDHDGHASLDASIMEGKEKRAGAVAGVTIIKNPITAARRVMEKTRHVLLVGHGADLFGIREKLEIVHPDYFLNPTNWDELQKEWKKDNPRFAKPARAGSAAGHRTFGTVGAVGLWNQGLAAGTSTGGLTNKMQGRVGDSPIIGAGTYADNAACAVSATGIGEFFIRYAIAHDIAARVKYQHLDAGEAAARVINQLKTLTPPEPTEGVQGVEGGVIVLDPKGNFATRYNSTQMTRGYIKDEGPPVVILFDKK
jgi:beta-aspartyl-peptidase (threonine type)